ncbi:MAG: hypothetical protein NZT92_02995, partial [Abditibacteriales bacterium]|nr:hypothetical protein [Abditibacteriales bacterium]MDW8365075.1 hypothetical protein [Abditibacteriales bacterium]
WWLSALACSLLCLALIAMSCLLFRLIGAPRISDRPTMERRLRPAEWLLHEQLRYGEETIAAVRVTLPAPLHPLHSPLWEGTPTLLLGVGIFIIGLGGLGVSIVGDKLGAPLSAQWQLLLILLWLVYSLLPLITDSGGTSLFTQGMVGLCAAAFGVMYFSLRWAEPATPFLGITLWGMAALNVAILLIRLLPLLRSPVRSLLVVTNQRVLLLGRRGRRWQMVTALTPESPVRVTLTARAVDALLHWQVGGGTFSMSAGLHEATELRALLSERFPYWHWSGDVRAVPGWWERFKRDGIWRLVLLLVLSAWVGWMWHQSILRLWVVGKLCMPPMETETADKWLARTQLAERLIPNEPFVSAARADALFAGGEWELAQQIWERLPESDYRKAYRKPLRAEAKWRAEVGRQFAPGSWQFHARLTAKMVERMTQKRRVSFFWVNRSRFHLRQAIAAGAPDALREVESLLRRAEVKEDLALVQEAGRKLQAVGASEGRASLPFGAGL